MALERERLIGQTAMITGGGRGLGRAFALGLAATGMSVAVVSRTDDELAETVRHVETAGGRAAAFRTDVSSPRDVVETVKAVERRFGKIDLLINNAGVGGPVGPAWQVDAEDWWSCLEINVRGTFLCCHAVLPGMTARGQGRIINVASYAGTLAVPYMSAYNASKTAVIRFTEALAAEVRKHGIPVFSIEPGTVRTAMTNRLITSDEGRRWLPWCEKLFSDEGDDSVEPATALVLFLSSGAGDELSGRVLSIRDQPADLARRIDHIKRENLYTLRLPRPQSAIGSRCEGSIAAGKKKDPGRFRKRHTEALKCDGHVQKAVWSRNGSCQPGLCGLGFVRQHST
jgi:NAD(P)-dependent dehydrogenase (short-subunit alcohol dehydrogenase family)